MSDCLSEDDVLQLVQGERTLAGSPHEAHLASCASCSALVTMLVANAQRDDQERNWGNLVGRLLGPYRLEGQIGAGAAGDVYRAWDVRLERYVAVKVLAPHVASSSEQVRRLQVEARAAAAIIHPNVVSVFDVGSDGVHFVVSELIEGESLRSMIDRGSISFDRAIELGHALACGLAAAHEKGVIHRDLKPSNLIVTRDGVLKILDFGLAKLTSDNKTDVDATPTGVVLGTAGYLSPEQARGESADERSDIFAVGAILYEMLCGERAFGGATFAERLSSVLRDDPSRMNAATLGNALPIVARCLAKSPPNRFQSARDLAWALEALMQAPRAPTKERSAHTAGSRYGLSRRIFMSGMAATGLGGIILGRGIYLSPSVSPIYRQLTYRHGRIGSARFTPDGGSVVYAAAWDGDPLTLFTIRLGGGGTRSLQLPSADVLSISITGKLAISLEHRYVAGMHCSGRLAVVPLEGGEPRILADDVQEADFSPDGKEMMVVRRSARGFQVEMPVGTTILDVEGWLSHARVSPDGHRIACLMHPSPFDDRGSVVVVERASRKLRTLAEGFTSIAGLAWAPDGRSVWCTAARDGSNNSLRSLSLEGKELVIAAATGRLRLHDIAKDGRAVVSHDNWRLRMMVKPPGANQEVDLSLTDLPTAGALSADGESIVFGECGDLDMDAGAYLRKTRGGQALRLGPGWPADISRDGRRVLACAVNPPGSLFLFDVSGGNPTVVPLGAIENVTSLQWGIGEYIVVVGAIQGRPSRLWRMSTTGGESIPLTAEGIYGGCRASPDGKRVAFIGQDGACLVASVENPGSQEVVPGRYPGEEVVGFSASGTDLFVRSGASPIRVRRVNIVTGEAQSHVDIRPPAVGLKGVDAVAVSASGEAYAYWFGQELSRLYTVTLGDLG